MSASVSTAVEPDTGRVPPHWRGAAVGLAVGLVFLGLLFHQEVVAAVQTWIDSTAYNHCFLIIPIAAYLAWDRRDTLRALAPTPLPWIALAALPLAVVWLAAERLGIMEGRQLVAMTVAETLFLGVLGWRLWWAAAGPLLYLYFLVPFGEFLTPRLQDITTGFVQHGLDLLHVPAYIDGYVIEIPQGTFYVAAACAGLRFLIASIAFGCLYALLMYRSPVRRAVFIFASIVVPVIANGLRALGIVWLGYLLGSAQAAAADHVLYGWIFFSLVILLLIVLGLPFREDGAQPRKATVSMPGVAAPAWRFVVTAVAVAVLAAIGPLVAFAFNRAEVTRIAAPAPIAPDQACTAGPVQAVTDHTAPGRVATQRVTCGDLLLDVTTETFSPRSTAAPVLAERRRLSRPPNADESAESWLHGTAGARPTWRIITSAQPAFVTAVAMWTEGEPARLGLAMRAGMARDSLMGARFMPVVMTVTPERDWSTLRPDEVRETENALRQFLLTHPELGAQARRPAG